MSLFNSREHAKDCSKYNAVIAGNQWLLRLDLYIAHVEDLTFEMKPGVLQTKNGESRR